MGWIPRIVVPVARSLHKQGIAVDVANFVHAPRIGSRAIHEYREIPHPDLAQHQFLEQLSRFIREGGHDTLIPADDQALTAITEHFDYLQNIINVACPPPAVTRLVLNKTLTLDIARKVGLQVPRTAVISNSLQLADFARDFPFPWILKPAEKENREEETKGYTLANVDEIAVKFPAPRQFIPPMLLQEYCSGQGVGIEMLMHDGNCLTAFQHRRLQELPYTGGFSVTAIAENPDPKLVEWSLALLRALHWEGPAMVEYKVNPQDGKAVFMEVNGRYWGSISLPMFAGIDFPLYQWQLAHGEMPLIPETYKVGMKWRWTAGHLARFHGLLAAARKSTIARKVLWLSLWNLPITFSPFVRDSLFSISDPQPAVNDLFQMLKYLSSRDIKALMRRVSTQAKYSQAA